MSQTVAIAAGAYAVAGGAISFSGWAFDIRRFTDWENNAVCIQPNTCVLLMLAGAALIALHARSRHIALVLGSIVALGGGLTLLQYIVGADFGFNHQLMFGRTWGQSTTMTPGRMGPLARADTSSPTHLRCASESRWAGGFLRSRRTVTDPPEKRERKQAERREIADLVKAAHAKHASR